MDFNLVKRVYNELPYFFKAPFSSYIRNKLIQNKVFLEQYELLNKNDTKSDIEKQAEQLEKLKEILRQAYEHSEYYHKIFEKCEFEPDNITEVGELSQLPILSKQDLKDNIDAIVVDNIYNFYTVTTAGTTGAPTMVYMENDAIFREWAFVYHFWAKYGYDYKKSRLATFRGVELGNKICQINPLYQEIRLNPFILSRENVKKYLKKIDLYHADFLYGYPSAIYSFCKIAKMESIDLYNKFKAVFLISENLYPFQETLIKEVLGCPIGIFYGHSERAVFAERNESGYHFNHAYGVTEIGNNGEPIVTGFVNGKTPLIRYQVDDMVKLNENGGYDIIGHRDDDILYGVNGEEISMAAVNFHDATFSKVDAYQFVQSEYGKCELYIKVTNDFTRKEVVAIQKAVQNKLGKALNCNVLIVPEIKLSKRGKYKMVIQNIEVKNHEKT